MQSFLGLGHCGTGFEQTLGNHERRYETQHENSFRRMVFSVTLRHGISNRLYDTSTDHGDDTGHQDHAGGIILEQVINQPKWSPQSWKDEIF